MVEIVIDQRVSLLIPKAYLNLPEGTVKIHFKFGVVNEVDFIDYIKSTETDNENSCVVFVDSYGKHFFKIPGVNTAIEQLEKMKILKNFKVIANPTDINISLYPARICINFSYTKENVLEELKDLYSTLVTNNIITKAQVEDKLLNSIIKLQNI